MKGILLRSIIPIVALAALAGLIFSVNLIAHPQSYPEVAELSGTHDTFPQYSDYFQKLAEKKGAPYAFDVLKRATFPADIDIHLLGHTIGDVLFKQQGLKGIQVCTPDFRDACSHSIVVGLFTERGVAALDDISAACRQAPGGKGAYMMCFHGLGHGILAYVNYDLAQAVGLCKKTGTEAYHDREYIECVGGTIMEMQYGAHDPTAWEKEKLVYFKADDPLYPCDSPIISDETKQTCYNYLTPHLFKVAGANLKSPSLKDFATAFGYCNALPEDDVSDRGGCYGGFGKEFVPLVAGRDIRDIGSMNTDELATVRRWCGLAGLIPGEAACDSAALASLFWGGENKPDAAFTFCAMASGPARDDCYRELTSAISHYLGGTPKAGVLCGRLPDPYRADCHAHI